MSALLSPRFCSETARLPDSFEGFREADDYVNAIARFGDLQRHRFQELANWPGFDSSKKSIVSVFQPKSGGTFLHNRMVELGYQEFWWLFPGRTCHSRCYADVEALQLYLGGGCTCHNHARPDPNILDALDRANVEKIWLHLRNPAESAVSAYHHYSGEGHGQGDAGALRRQQALDEAERQGLSPSTDKSTFVRGAIDFCVTWVAEWLRFAQQHPGLVVFSFYRELADPESLFQNVFEQFGAKLTGRISSKPISVDRFREKKTADWRADLTAAVEKYVERRVRAELEPYPQFSDLWF